MDSSSNPSPRLVPHSRIAIIGGGPAGSFFALSALHIAAPLNLPLDITLFERKDLTAAGPRGCNMCAGILSHRVLQGLDRLNISLPPEIILGRVRTYLLHWRDHAIGIQPPDPARQVISVYRAGGPRKSPYAPTQGLDEFLLQQAQTRGARVIHERVERISFDPLPIVHTASLDAEFDLVVLATGVNATPPILDSVDYVLPKTETMAQDSLLIETDQTRVQMESTVHVYFDQPRDLIFGALVPKGKFATVSLLGRHLERNSLSQFLNIPEVTAVVGNLPPQMCGCRPRVSIAPARGYYADRFVAIGDSCVTRLYKDGIGSALATAHAAAETALLYGIERQAFAEHYAPICRRIDADNRFGRFVFGLIAHSKRNAYFMRGLGHALKSELREPPPARILSGTLWALFTGDSNYAEISRMLLNPRGLARLCKGMLKQISAH